MNNTIEINDKIKQIILELIPDLEESELSGSSDIFELGLDSINAMTLVFNLQEAFSVQFEASEIDVDNFRSVEDISALIQRKL